MTRILRRALGLGLVLATFLLLAGCARAQGGDGDLSIKKNLLSELEYENDVVSPTDPWGSPSNWMRDWISRARAKFVSPIQVNLLDDLNYQNDQVSPKIPWGSPSQYLRDWIGKMRATLQN
ncbi:hypothetical protein Vafri_6643 [Volvox africanus]|uniref:Uncharacterized protein n=1 Tax=Volvox africanus TaxID=51714 RepID=A0A8J4AYR4_9CHLO|nr:hypothetical protein Vafri_6643 [Volvox africanus]